MPSFLIESSPTPIYRRITAAYQQALERQNHQVIYFEPDRFGNFNDALNRFIEVVQSKKVEYLLVFENSPFSRLYMEASEQFVFEQVEGSIIFVHHDNVWSSLTDRNLLAAWRRISDRSIHFFLEYSNFLDFRKLGFHHAYTLSHGSEFEKVEPPDSYLYDVSFVGHTLPDFQTFFEPIQHFSWSHLIAADFWSRLAALDKKLQPSSIAFARANQPSLTLEDAEFIDRTSAYQYLISVMSITFRGELIKRLDPQFNLAIIGGDPAYLNGAASGRHIERDSITYHPPLFDYTETQNLYSGSKINLNITSTQFDVAVNNRVIDVASTGGFILTDWKSDLVQLTSVSEQISYRTIEELNNKIAYYLSHEQERLEIAAQLQRDVAEKSSYDQIIRFLLSKVFSMSNDLETQSKAMYVDLGCGVHKPEGFIGVDCSPAPHVDIVADLNQEFPFPDNSVEFLRAHDVVEHLSDRIYTMNEIWRVCKPNAEIDIRVPSTDGRGAFQDPTHISFWNINSFNYYCVEFPAYIDLCRRYGFKGAFSIVHLDSEAETADRVVHVRAILKAIKFDSYLPEELREKLKLREVNLIVFLNWSQAEDDLYTALVDVIRLLTLHPDRQKITLLIDAGSFPLSDEASAHQVLYDLVLNIFLTEGIDVAGEGLEISLIDHLSSDEWLALAQQISYQIRLEQGNSESIDHTGLADIPLLDLEMLGHQQF